MNNRSRRDFTKIAAGALGGIALAPILAPTVARAAAAKIVVIGGGFGGATAAKYLRLLDSSLDITLIEAQKTYHTGPMSNLVLSGMKTLSAIEYGYGALRLHYGIKVLHARADKINSGMGSVQLVDGSSVPFDRAIVSPGISFQPNPLPGYAKDAEKIVPHAWRAGPQTALLRKQLVAMPDGGTVIICPPPNPYRCPPSPYERASMIAHYLKAAKPKSKIIVLDAKEKFSKQGLFMPAWEEIYVDMIEWRAASAGGKVSRIDIKKMEVETEFGAEPGDVINYIPPQRAGAIAHRSGLADKTGWCPVDGLTLESTLVKKVHVIGDSARAGTMPKSGFAANSQGKFAAASIVAMLRGKNPDDPIFANACYSLIAPDYGISVTGEYRPKNGKIERIAGAGGISPKQATAAFRAAEARHAQSWYQAITQDMFG